MSTKGPTRGPKLGNEIKLRSASKRGQDFLEALATSDGDHQQGLRLGLVTLGLGPDFFVLRRWTKPRLIAHPREHWCTHQRTCRGPFPGVGGPSSHDSRPDEEGTRLGLVTRNSSRHLHPLTQALFPPRVRVFGGNKAWVSGNLNFRVESHYPKRCALVSG